MERTGRKGDPNPRLYASRSATSEQSCCSTAGAAAGRGSEAEGQCRAAGPVRHGQGQVDVDRASFEAFVEEQVEARFHLDERPTRHDQEAVTRTCSRS